MRKGLIQFRIPNSLRELLARKAREENTTMTQILLIALTEYLNQRGDTK